MLPTYKWRMHNNNLEIRGAFHLSQLTGQPIPILMRISLLIKTNHPKILYTEEIVFQLNLFLLEKAYFIARKSGPAMVRPASSEFLKAL